MNRDESTGCEPQSKRRPRVLFAIAGLGLGGSERQLVELLVRIHPSEVDATLVTLDPSIGSSQLRRLLDAGVRHEPLGVLPATARTYGRAALRLGRVFRSLRPDVAYPWLEQATSLVAPVAR